MKQIKYLYIREYLKTKKGIPIKKNNEYDLDLKDRIIRSSVIAKNTYDKSIVYESINNTQDKQLYNDVTVDTVIIPLDNIILYDYLDIDRTQKLAYVYECPICLSNIISSDKDIEYCPHCENSTYPFNLLALVNIDQTRDFSKTKDDKNISVKFNDKQKNEIEFNVNSNDIKENMKDA